MTAKQPRTTKQMLDSANRNLEQNSGTLATSTGNGTSGHQGNVHPDVKIMVNMLFARFHHIYTHKFESAYGDDDTMAYAKREWALALQDYPMRAVEQTIDAVRTRYSWPPTIAEFLTTLSEVARPDDLPDARDAYQESCFHATRPLVHHWRHPAVYHAARQTGFFRLRSEPEQYVWPEFQRHYQTLVLRVCKGETLVLPDTPELPPPANTGPALDVNAFCDDYGLDPKAVAHLFHYLELPAESQTRLAFRRRAVAQLQAFGVTEDQLPH